jgi:hypothetical protein
MKTFEPISAQELKEVDLLIEDYMDKSKYENKYKGDNDAIIKYLMLSRRYLYLAFTFKTNKLKLPDLLGIEFTERWTKDLLEFDEFKEIHAYLKDYYPELRKFIERLSKQQKINEIE